MFTIIRYLWLRRDRPSLGSREWGKAWAKRLLQLPSLFKQTMFHGMICRRGGRVAPSAFFSDPAMITGQMQKLEVGEHSFVGRAELSVHAQLSIGRCVCINDDAKLLTASHDVTDQHWATVAKPIVVEDYVWIASGAIILSGVTLGRGAVVGAGAVVSKDVPPSGIVAGNPAVLLKKKRTSNLQYQPTAFLAMFTAWRRNSAKSVISNNL